MIAANQFAARTPSSSAVHGWAVLGILAFALLLRMVFYTGYFGSDEVTYVEYAFKLLDGDWTVSSYVGANRYGVNLPIAAFAALFGRSEWSAALYAIACSMAEIALVACFAGRLIGQRAALLAALVLACLPTHVHLAGRLMADTPLALMITASFLFFFDGELRRRPWSYFIAGCAAGFSFWIKPATVFYLLVFLLYPLVFRRFDHRWLWMVLGFALVILANNLLFLVLTGDAMFLLKAMSARSASGYLENEAAKGVMHDSPQTYFNYLFVKVHHTWLLGYLAAIGAFIWLVQRRRGMTVAHDQGLKFVAFWCIGVIGVLSLLVVSFQPLMFVPKQTNYMLMFATPLALLAGYMLAQLQGVRLGALLALVILPSILLAALHQSTVHVFTANSKAAVQFAAANPQARIFASTNPYRAAVFHNLVHPASRPARIGSMSELEVEHRTSTATGGNAPAVLAILDLTTLAWAGSEPVRRLEDAPQCWRRQEVLTPELSGTSTWLLSSLFSIANRLPATAREPVAARLHAHLTPANAIVFLVPPGCRWAN